MKIAVCGHPECNHRIRGSTSRKMRKKERAHYVETGHRLFKKVKGFGK